MISVPSAMDNKLFQALRRIKAPNLYESLCYDPIAVEKQKRMFFSGVIENPSFDYPYLNIDKVLKAKTKLIKLGDKIEDYRLSPLVLGAYRKKIQEKISQMNLLIAASSRDMELFKKENEFLFGAVDKIYYADVLARIKKGTIRRGIENEDPKLRKFAQKLHDTLFQESDLAQKDIRSIPIPDKAYLKKFASWVDSSRQITNILPKAKALYDSEDICTVFNYSLEKEGIGTWKALIDHEKARKAIVTDAKKRIIHIPISRNYKLIDIKRLDAHEVKTHVLRRVTGHASRLRLLGFGLSGYEKAEEGLATVHEQLLVGHMYDYSRLERYFAIGLVLGIYSEKKNFRETFTIIRDYKLLKKMLRERRYIEQDQKVDDLAWNLCLRIFRGTTCSKRGVCLLKDKIYREGNMEIWNYIQNNDLKNNKHLLLGKFDPTNNEHQALVDLAWGN